MDTACLHHFLPSKPPIFTINPRKLSPQNQILFSSLRHRHQQALRINSINGTDTSSGETGGDSAPPQPPPSITSPETVEIRFRRRSRRRSKQWMEDGEIGNGRPKNVESKTKSDTPKKWEDMSVAEKAMELYVGEKGLLFWLNKFAYASIFIVIGGWILFRFVGPSLNLYQLDTPPLAPTSMFKGE